MRCPILHQLHNLKNVKNSHGGVILLIKLQPVTLMKLTLLRKCFSRFLIGTNGAKSCKASHIYLQCKKGLQ